MLITFCLRLACGMIGCLLLLKSNEINPRFFRTHYLVALGLIGLATIGSISISESPEINHRSSYFSVSIRLAVLVLAAILCIIGSTIWSIEGNPGYQIVGVASVLTLSGALAIQSASSTSEVASIDSK